MIRKRSLAVPSSFSTLDAVFLHQTRYSLPRHLPPPAPKFSMNPRGAICATPGRESAANVHQQPLVLLFSIAGLSPEPCMKAAARHFQDTTQHLNRVVGPLGENEREPHVLSFAKKAAAF